MPLYEYRCESCGEPFEKMVRFSEADLQPACPNCGSEATHKQISTVASFCGSGSDAVNMSGGSCGSGRGFT